VKNVIPLLGDTATIEPAAVETLANR